MLILKILLFPQFAVTVTVYQGGGWYITTEVIEIDHIQCYRFGHAEFIRLIGIQIPYVHMHKIK